MSEKSANERLANVIKAILQIEPHRCELCGYEIAAPERFCGECTCEDDCAP